MYHLFHKSAVFRLHRNGIRRLPHGSKGGNAMNKTWKKILMPLIGLLAMLMMTCMVQARPGTVPVSKIDHFWNESTGEMQLSWAQVSGMNGSRKYYYRLYNRNGKIVRTGVANQRFTDGTVGTTIRVSNNRTIYGLSVRGRTGNSYGAWSAKKWMVPQPQIYSVTKVRSGSALRSTFKWRPIAGAYKGYRVYMSRSANSGYSLLGTTKGTSWTKTLSVGTYYFRIQAVCTSTAASPTGHLYTKYVVYRY